MTNTNRTHNALLFAVALGLWANVLTAWIGPVSVYAQDNQQIVRELQDISREVKAIALGVCINSKIC